MLTYQLPDSVYSCGKLTTGVSVKPWTGIFMLRNSSSPETYFQAAFRVQTPWTIKNPDSPSPNKEEIIKQEFQKVTGLGVKDFELLVSLGVFKSALMNDAVYKLKCYEDASFEYIGINKHEGEDIGWYDTVLTSKEYKESFVNENELNPKPNKRVHKRGITLYSLT